MKLDCEYCILDFTLIISFHSIFNYDYFPFMKAKKKKWMLLLLLVFISAINCNPCSVCSVSLSVQMLVAYAIESNNKTKSKRNRKKN